jgi:hypothetical protein
MTTYFGKLGLSDLYHLNVGWLHITLACFFNVGCPLKDDRSTPAIFVLTAHLFTFFAQVTIFRRPLTRSRHVLAGSRGKPLLAAGQVSGNLLLA